MYYIIKIMSTPTRILAPEQKTALIAETKLQQQNLQRTLTSLNNKIQATITPTQTESFESFTDLAISSINYNTEHLNYINNYKNSFNQINDIIDTDDTTKYNKKAFDTYLYIQNKKLTDLQESINGMPTRPNVSRPIKAIKNIDNSQILNIEKYPNPTATEPTPTTPNDYYLIYANNKCVEFIPPTTPITPTNPISTSPGTIAETGWDLKPCNASNPNQQFKLTNIQNQTVYNNMIYNDNNKSKYTLNDASSSLYGFYTVNPNNDTYKTHCLQLNDDGLSVVPCNLESSQRFKTFYQSVLP